MERITDTHVFFWGSEFSNFYSCKFTYKGIEFLNSEQAFMWEKAIYFGDVSIGADILNAKTPGKAKALGRQVEGFDSKKWMEVCFDFMVNVNIAKYASDPYLKDILLSTGNKTIVESSPEDTIWGIGLHTDDDRVLDESKWRGMNLLGKALMEVRKRLNEGILKT
jgi:ribA/ribD-fused uncharacterized protein